MSSNSFVFICICSLLLNCKNDRHKEMAEPTDEATEKPNFKNKGHQLIYNMVQKVGDYHQLKDKRDVSYTYTYTTPDGKRDISEEKYIFDDELSYGKYTTHQRTLPELEGIIEQGYDGETYWLKHKGELVDDEAALKRVAFNRPTNFYWFTMMQKLLDPGLNYEYLGETTIDSADYDIVKITFDSTYNKPKDIYQVYINKETSLIDQFLFTVADFNLMSPKLMQVEYTDVGGILIPSKRQYKDSTWDAEVTDAPWIYVAWTDINFGNGLTIEQFQK